MRVMIVAGEASGDLHGAGVVKELKARMPDADIFGIGGDKMQNAGMQLVFHVRELSFMGFWEVIQHLPLLRSVERTMAALLKARKPDVVLLIDYPGFNLRFAQVARREGVTVMYYISPQVWAWNPGRVRKMKELIRKMFVVFPFEVPIYEREGIDVEFVGHPLLEVLSEPQRRPEFCKRWGLEERGKIVGLFPGSRKQEIERIFPAMLGAARMLNRDQGAQIVVGASPSLDIDYLRSFLRGDFPVTIVQNATYDVMKNSDVALVTSGTATLETGYYQTPMIVVYKTSALTYLIGRLLVRVKNIGLVNIVAGSGIVPEYIQWKATPANLAAETADLLNNDDRRKKIAQSLRIVRDRLGTPGASARVANAIAALA